MPILPRLYIKLKAKYKEIYDNPFYSPVPPIKDDRTKDSTSITKLSNVLLPADLLSTRRNIKTTTHAKSEIP